MEGCKSDPPWGMLMICGSSTVGDANDMWFECESGQGKGCILTGIPLGEGCVLTRLPSPPNLPEFFCAWPQRSNSNKRHTYPKLKQVKVKVASPGGKTATEVLTRGMCAGNSVDALIVRTPEACKALEDFIKEHSDTQKLLKTAQVGARGGGGEEGRVGRGRGRAREGEGG